MRTAYLLVFFLGFLALVSSQGTSGSSDDNPNQVDIRTLDVSLTTDLTVGIEARSNNIHFRDLLRTGLQVFPSGNNLFALDFEYQASNGSDDNLHFQFQLRSIMEYIDENDNDQYDAGEEIFNYRPPQVWVPWIHTFDDVDDDAVVHHLTVVTLDGVLNLTVHVATKTTGKVDVNGFKFDLEVENFPFTSPNSTGIVLVTRLQTDGTIEDDHDDRRRQAEDEQIRIRSEENLEIRGRFSWENTMTISDDDDADVHRGSLQAFEGGIYQMMFWVNEHRDFYRWDPEMAVEYGARSEEASSSSAASMKTWISLF